MLQNKMLIISIDSESMLSVCLSICLSIYLSIALHPFVTPWPLVQFLIFYTVDRSPSTGNQSVARPLPAHRTAQTHNKRTQTSMHRVKFEPTISLFEWPQTVHVADRAATVAGT
jgi:hypothetical protein